MRYRSFCPSLRCQTSYSALDEARKQHELDDWVRRVTDDEYDHQHSLMTLLLFSKGSSRRYNHGGFLGLTEPLKFWEYVFGRPLILLARI